MSLTLPTSSACDGWPAEARALVERSIAAHGGLERWRATRSIRLPFDSATGLLFLTKGYGRTFVMPRELETFPHERTTIFHGFPDAAHRGCFLNGDVRVENVANPSDAVASPGHRATLRGPAKYRFWTNMDALYFFGYAVWHYHVLPFTLGDARFVRLLGAASTWTGVEVEFAADVPTHCRRQQFYFGGDGRIVRHDYVAEVMGQWARGCHYWENYVVVAGLAVARRRRVAARILGWPIPVTVLDVTLGEPSVQT